MVVLRHMYRWLSEKGVFAQPPDCLEIWNVYIKQTCMAWLKVLELALLLLASACNWPCCTKASPRLLHVCRNNMQSFVIGGTLHLCFIECPVYGTVLNIWCHTTKASVQSACAHLVLDERARIVEEWHGGSWDWSAAWALSRAGARMQQSNSKLLLTPKSRQL